MLDLATQGGAALCPGLICYGPCGAIESELRSRTAIIIFTKEPQREL